MDTIKNRSEMENFFDSLLLKTYEDISTQKKYSYGRNAVKSYIVEVHDYNAESSREDVIETIISKAKHVDPESQIRETQEASLLQLTTKNAEYFIDIGTYRFLKLHTANTTKVTDPFIKKFYSSDGFDSLWLPIPLLLKAANLGRFWGMGVTFKESIESQVEDEFEKEEVQDVNLQVKRHFALEFYNLLMQSSLSSIMGISRVSILRASEYADKETDQEFIIDDIKYNGKMTARGNSYSKHSGIVHELVHLYKSALEKLESFGLSFEEGRLSGNPVTINFSKSIPISKLVKLVFNGEEPFRLWGIPDYLGEEAVRVYAVDMHHGNTGNKLTFEITPRYMRVSMPKYSCANTILRLFANINHHVDAMADLEVVDYELKVHPFGAGSS